ncbi:hypothetical protein V6N12_010333 [Hibiscus sabdariffa]|uniref:CCHC-type domain-containing protein n=1 Tax=Hibiscus sabdariffa TaxID=183260 RepID=A0ABR2EM44_9ROSI
MSQESVGNTVGASNNVNRHANNLNLQDVIREMDRLLQQRFRPMQERIEQLEEISLEGQLSQRRYNSVREEEYDGEIDEEQAYERATRQGLRQHEPRHQRGPFKPKPTFSLNEKGGPLRNVKPIAETNKGRGTTMSARPYDVQCFKCLGRGHIASKCLNCNTMLRRDDGEVESEHEEDKNKDDAIQEEELEHAVEGEALIVKRSLMSRTYFL